MFRGRGALRSTHSANATGKLPQLQLARQVGKCPQLRMASWQVPTTAPGKANPRNCGLQVAATAESLALSFALSFALAFLLPLLSLLNLPFLRPVPAHCSATPEHHLSDALQPTSLVHAFHFDMSPVEVASFMPSDLAMRPLPPLWHQCGCWLHYGCPPISCRCAPIWLLMHRWHGEFAGKTQKQRVHGERLTIRNCG